ncbi:MAG: beta-galactosidase [Acidobacteriota bacterium]
MQLWLLAPLLLLVPVGCTLPGGKEAAADSVYSFEPVALEFPREGGSIQIVSEEAGTPWEQAQYLVFDAFHETDYSLTLSLQFFKKDESEPQIRVHWGVMPKLQTRIIFPLEALDGQSIFLPRQPRSLKGNVRGRRLPVEMIGRVKLGLFPSPSEQKVSIARKAKLPYVIPLSSYPTTEVLLYRDFPDVYDPAYAEAAINYARQLESFKNDPYLIGYFLDNEPHWAFGQNNLAAEMIATETPSHTRRALVSWLKERCQGDITTLSAAWKHSFNSFEQLETQPLLEADELSEKAAADLWEFSALMVGRYVNIVCREVEKVDPNHLNLGLRYASISSDLCYRAGEYFDVFSINSYRMEPPADVIAEISRRTGRPVLIGEFHFGALDRGLPSTGLRGVANQEERGVAYRYYLEQGALIPELIGMHYFIWNDQPVLGRFDGENYNIGLIGVCGIPYEELVGAATTTHERLYRVAAGELEPFSRPAQEIPRVAF